MTCWKLAAVGLYARLLNVKQQWVWWEKESLPLFHAVYFIVPEQSRFLTATHTIMHLYRCSDSITFFQNKHNIYAGIVISWDVCFAKNIPLASNVRYWKLGSFPSTAFYYWVLLTVTKLTFSDSTPKLRTLVSNNDWLEPRRTRTLHTQSNV